MSTGDTRGPEDYQVLKLSIGDNDAIRGELNPYLGQDIIMENSGGMVEGIYHTEGNSLGFIRTAGDDRSGEGIYFSYEDVESVQVLRDQVAARESGRKMLVEIAASRAGMAGAVGFGC